MTGYAMLLAIVFLTGQGQTLASRFDTVAACEAELTKIVGKIAEHNSKAAPPEYIAFYSVACTEIKTAPKGHSS